LNKVCKEKEFVFDFDIEKTGIYGIEITASAKSKDEDLLVKIDNIEFPKKSGKKGLFDSEVAWNGSNLKGFEKTRLKTFEKEFNLAPNLHYIELWTDRSPQIEEMKIVFTQPRRVPTVTDPKWTGDLRDDPDEILLARLIFGEARNQPREAKIWVASSVLNRVKSKAWPDTIQGVILQAGQYDPLKSPDSNYIYVIDPQRTSIQADITAWRESYEIARDIILGQIKNPTDATHFHGIGISKERFLQRVIPKGKFLKKIGDTYFFSSPN
jgi:hypothetical protein